MQLTIQKLFDLHVFSKYILGLSLFFFLSCPNLLIGTIPVLGNLFFSFIYLYFNALLVFEECTHVIYYIYYLPKYFVTMMMIMQVL